MDQFLRHIYRHWLKYLFGTIVVVMVIGMVVTILPVLADSGSDHDWSRLVTIAEYDSGKKIQVRESILWIVGFLLLILFSNLRRHCNHVCKHGRS